MPLSCAGIVQWYNAVYFDMEDDSNDFCARHSQYFNVSYTRKNGDATSSLYYRAALAVMIKLDDVGDQPPIVSCSKQTTLHVVGAGKSAMSIMGN